MSRITPPAASAGTANGQTATAPTATPKKTFKVISQVTRELLRIEKDQAVYIRIMRKHYTGNVVKGGRGGQQQMEPAEMLDCENLEKNNAASQLVAGKVLVSILDEKYPNDAYVGRCFEIIRTKRDDKRYNEYTVAEVEDPEPHRAPKAA